MEWRYHTNPYKCKSLSEWHWGVGEGGLMLEIDKSCNRKNIAGDDGSFSHTTLAGFESIHMDFFGFNFPRQKINSLSAVNISVSI